MPGEPATYVEQFRSRYFSIQDQVNEIILEKLAHDPGGNLLDVAAWICST